MPYKKKFISISPKDNCHLMIKIFDVSEFILSKIYKWTNLRWIFMSLPEKEDIVEDTIEKF
jgi:hypothetical protein